MDTIEEFIEAYQDPFYLGIDPGATGGLGLVSSCGQALVRDIPVTKIKRKGGTTTVADHAGIVDFFDQIDGNLHRGSLLICLEKAQVQIKGKGSNAYTGFRVGVSYGMWSLFLYDRGFPAIVEVNPITWKKQMGLTKQDKNQIRLYAKKLYPLVEGLERKSDHNRAEAVLLAHYRKQERL
jgi:hypothetical protein